MSKYIDAERLKKSVESIGLIPQKQADYNDGRNDVKMMVLDIIDSLQQEQPEPYFYCKYGGIMPLCSDCKRNHSNSSFETEEITTWYTPSCGTKQCIDYIQREQPEVDLEEAAQHVYESWIWGTMEDVHRDMVELGKVLNTRKEE